MALLAAPREVDGVVFDDPIAYVAAEGLDANEARAVINAYKAFYAKGKPAGGWVHYVVTNTPGVDEAKAAAIMRRYRRFYGK